MQVIDIYAYMGRGRNEVVVYGERLGDLSLNKKYRAVQTKSFFNTLRQIRELSQVAPEIGVYNLLLTLIS